MDMVPSPVFQLAIYRWRLTQNDCIDLLPPLQVLGFHWLYDCPIGTTIIHQQLQWYQIVIALGRPAVGGDGDGEVMVGAEGVLPAAVAAMRVGDSAFAIMIAYSGLNSWRIPPKIWNIDRFDEVDGDLTSSSQIPLSSLRHFKPARYWCLCVWWRFGCLYSEVTSLPELASTTTVELASYLSGSKSNRVRSLYDEIGGYNGMKFWGDF